MVNLKKGCNLMVSKIENLIFGEDKYSKSIISLMLYFLLIIVMCFACIIALKHYQFYNFFMNEGVAIRFLKVLPLVVLSIYANVYMIPKVINSFSNLYLFLFMIINSIPLIFVYVVNGIADSKNVIVFVYIVVMATIISIYLVNNFNIKFPQIKLSTKAFWIFIVVFSIVGYGVLLKDLGLPKNIIKAFTDVYPVRLSYRKVAGRFDDYFVQWFGNVLNPFLLAYSIRKKNYKLAGVPVVLQLILYGYSAYKSIWVTLLLAPFFAYTLSQGLKKTFLEASIILVMIFGTAMGFAGKLGLYLKAVFRIFLWPPLIALEYYDFFWMYPKVKLAHSVLGKVFSNVYGMEPAFYMGSLYYGKPSMRLNVNWYGDAYMNFGIVGVIVFTLMISVMLLFIKNFENKDIYYVSALLFGGVLSLFNGPLLTTLLTNGLGLGLLLAYLLPNDLSTFDKAESQSSKGREKITKS